MSKFKKEGSKEQPAVSTASLPDIVFMLLFFFMVATVMRETTLKVNIDKPDATEVQKLENKAMVDYIYVGPPIDVATFGPEPKVQLNDALIDDLTEIREFIRLNRERRDEAERPLITTSLKVDAKTKMGKVTDIKQELREVQALKINYSTMERSR